MLSVRLLAPQDLRTLLDRFVAVTCDVVDAGASLGWASPMSDGVARRYWETRASALDGHGAFLFGAFDDGVLAGSVQLERGHFPQSRHRGEVAKLMVHTAYRRRGVARRLMEALEEFATRAGIETLVLDTRPGEPVEHLYEAMRYTRTGRIPAAIRGPHGEMQDTVFYYKSIVGSSGAPPKGR